jgi:hypothetical protein
LPYAHCRTVEARSTATVYVRAASPSAEVTSIVIGVSPRDSGTGDDAAPAATTSPSTVITALAGDALAVTVVDAILSPTADLYASVPGANPDVSTPLPSVRLVSAGSAAHARSEVAVGARASYSLFVQAVSAAHTRSELAVGAAVSHCPAVQAVTAAHARSEVAVGAADSYWPAVHVLSSAHARSDVAVGAVVSYWPLVHAVSVVHSRSDVAIGASDSYWPVVHLVSVAHARSDVAVGAADSYWSVVHAVSAAHTRSAVAVGDALSYWPAVHAVSAAHARSEVAVGGVASYRLVAQGVSATHTRSEVAAGGLASYSSSRHGVNAAHARSEIGVGRLVSYWPAVHAVTAAHSRSEVVAVGGLASYSPSRHAVSAAQRRSEVRVGRVVSYWPDVHAVSGAHTRSAVEVGGLASYFVVQARRQRRAPSARAELQWARRDEVGLPRVVGARRAGVEDSRRCAHAPPACPACALPLHVVRTALLSRTPPLARLLAGTAQADLGPPLLQSCARWARPPEAKSRFGTDGLESGPARRGGRSARSRGAGCRRRVQLPGPQPLPAVHRTAAHLVDEVLPHVAMRNGY